MKYSVTTYLKENSMGFDIDFIKGSTLRKVTNTNMLYDVDANRQVTLYIGDPKNLKEIARYKNTKALKADIKSGKRKLKKLGVVFQQLEPCDWYFVSSASGGPGGRKIDKLKCDVHNHTKDVFSDSGRRAR